jgi:hypothetical protein
MADKMQHQTTDLEKAVSDKQNHKPGELGAKDPAGKLMGGLKGQQTGFDEGGQGDAINLEDQNRRKR